MTNEEILAILGERPAPKRDRSTARAIAEYERKLAALYPYFPIPSAKQIRR